MKNENRIKGDFYEDLESHNYTRDEVMKYARQVKFFVSEGAVKRAFNKALVDLEKLYNSIYKKHYQEKLSRKLEHLKKPKKESKVEFDFVRTCG